MENNNSETKVKDRAQQLVHSDEALWREVRAASIREGITMTEFVERLLRKELGLKKK